MAINIILLGAPGTGKGTQAARLAQAHRIPQISTGEIFRDAVRLGTDLGLKAKPIMERGDLLPDDLTVPLVLARLAAPDCGEGFVLDGFPRSVAQACALDTALGHRQSFVVLELVAPEEELRRRFAVRRICAACGQTLRPSEPQAGCPRCGSQKSLRRRDDAAEVVNERLAVYVRATRALVEYYQGRPTFRSIDGTGSIENVAGTIAHALHDIQAGVTSTLAAKVV